MKRTLSLRRDRLTELNPAELSAVAAAEAAPSGLTCPVRDCFVDSNLGMCYSWVC